MDLRKIVENSLKPGQDSELLITESPVILNSQTNCYPRDLIKDFKYSGCVCYIILEFDELCFNLMFRPNKQEVFYI
jgi:hypothetical protein